MTSWKKFTLSIRGRLHEKEGVPCQDRVVGMSYGSFAALALSDGAGSASLSHIGSKIVTNTFLHFLKANFSEVYEKDSGYLQVIERIRYNLERQAKKFNVPVKEFSSTLIGLALNNEKLFFIHVGDGIAGFVDTSGAKVLSKGAKGEFDNETYFVTSEEAENTMVCLKDRTSENISAFFLMSDGASRILFDKKMNAFAPAFWKIMLWMDNCDYRCLKKIVGNSLKALPAHYIYDDFSIGVLKRVKYESVART